MGLKLCCVCVKISFAKKRHFTISLKYLHKCGNNFVTICINAYCNDMIMIINISFTDSDTKATAPSRSRLNAKLYLCCIRNSSSDDFFVLCMLFCAKKNTSKGGQ